MPIIRRVDFIEQPSQYTQEGVMKLSKVFAIGDVHGKLDMLETLLKKWNPDNERLILLGDLIDRGHDAYGVLKIAQHLHKTYGAVILKGNHEELFVSWLEEPESEFQIYYPQGGRETLLSFFKQDLTFSLSPTEITEKLNASYQEYIEFINQLPYFYEWENYLFVHAGVNLELRDWKKSSTADFCWIRRPFHYGLNETGKIIVFGHTETHKLNPYNSSDIWLSPCKTKIGIDGGAVFGGQLHGVSIGTEGIMVHSVDNELRIKEGVVCR